MMSYTASGEASKWALIYTVQEVEKLEWVPLLFFPRALVKKMAWAFCNYFFMLHPAAVGVRSGVTYIQCVLFFLSGY